MSFKHLSLLFLLTLSSVLSITSNPILAGVKLRIESSTKSEPQLEWVPYGSTITKSSVLGEVDVLYVAPRFDSSVTAKLVHDKHYNTAMICLHSSTAKSCFRATHDKDLVPTIKVKASDLVQAEYDMYYLLFTPGGRTASEPILWSLGKVNVQSGKMDHPVDVLERVGPNAWRDSAFKMPLITPTDPQKYVPGVSVFTPFFMVLFLAPWLLLIPMWYKLGANARGIHSSVQIFVQFIFFFGSLVLLFGVLVLNWLYLDIFSTLRAVIPLSMAVIVFGAIHLRSVALDRLST